MNKDLVKKMRLFSIILADPPWSYELWSEKGEGRSAESHYITQSPDWIANLNVASIAAETCFLFLWVTGPCLDQGIETGKAWGWQYKTIAFNWVKRYRTNKWFKGLGYYTRANSELCLLFTRGKGPKRPENKGVCQIVSDGLLPDDFDPNYMFPQDIITVPGRHSAKPIEVYDRIESMYPHLTDRAYLFSRDNRPGWLHLGNEVTGNDMTTDLKLLSEGKEICVKAS